MNKLSILRIPTYILSIAHTLGIPVTELMKLLLGRAVMDGEVVATVVDRVRELLCKDLPAPNSDDPNALGPSAGMQEAAARIVTAFDVHWETAGMGSFPDLPVYIPIGRNQYAVVRSMTDYATIEALHLGLTDQRFETSFYLHHSVSDMVFKDGMSLASVFTRACEWWDERLSSSYRVDPFKSDDYTDHLQTVYGGIIDHPEYHGKSISQIEVYAADLADKYHGLNYRVNIKSAESDMLPGKFEVSIDVLP